MERLKHLMQAIDDWQQVTVLGFVLQGRSDLSERIVDSTLAQFPSSARRSATRSRRAGCGAAGWPWGSGSGWPCGAGWGWPRRPRTP